MDWPHSPVHRLAEPGAYIVTAGTYQKKPLFGSRDRLTFLCQEIFRAAKHNGWKLQAWAVFPNHYHYVAVSPQEADSLRRLTKFLHSFTSTEINKADRSPGRKVWHQYWDSQIRDQRSYFARLSYVHHNPVHHKVVAQSENYEWCSAAWLQRTASRAFYKTVISFPHARVTIEDDFDVEQVTEG